jgi:hypothetical protein
MKIPTSATNRKRAGILEFKEPKKRLSLEWTNDGREKRQEKARGWLKQPRLKRESIRRVWVMAESGEKFKGIWEMKGI